MQAEPITSETFPKVWRYTARKRYWAKKNALIRSWTGFVSQTLFFCTAVILSYGILLTLSTGLVRQFLMLQPMLAEAWEGLSDMILAGARSNGQKLGHLALFLYGPPLAAGLAAALAAELLYHPRSLPLPEGEQEQARQLWVMTQHIRGAEEKQKNHVLTFCAILYGLMAAGIVAFFLLYNAKNPQIAGELQTRAGPAGFYFGAGTLAGLLVYLLLNIPMRLVLDLLFSTRVPAGFYDSVGAYYRRIRNQK